MIYFIQDAGNGHIKIGYSADPWKRLGYLQIGSPVALELMAAMAGDRGDERALHRVFSADCVRGEWYRASPAVLAYVASAGPPPPKSGKRRAWGDSGLSTAEVAALAGISVSQLGKYRTGVSEPSLSGAIRLSKITGLPVEAFAKRGGA